MNGVANADTRSIIRPPRRTHYEKIAFTVSTQRQPPEALVSNQSAVQKPAVSQRTLLLRRSAGLPSILSFANCEMRVSLDAQNVFFSIPTAILDNP
jgi:hypothetical protein